MSYWDNDAKQVYRVRCDADITNIHDSEQKMYISQELNFSVTEGGDIVEIKVDDLEVKVSLKELNKIIRSLSIMAE